MAEQRISRFLIVVLITFFSCHSTDKKPVQSESYASLLDSTRYVGINTCKQCHADKFETFTHTGMGMSFDVASHKKSSAVFSEHPLITDKFKNLQYYPFWKNDSLYLTEFRLAGRDTVYSRTEKISYIVGSGQHTNSHMIDVNGYLYQAPATFYTQKGKWDLPPGFENGFNSRFNRKIELECMTCHNAYPKIVSGSINKFEAIPSGIDCERCHGPGSAHVSEKQNGLIVDVKSKIDYSIVNPAKLPIDYQLDVCQRCHIQGNAVLRTGKSFFDFKPGMRLAEVMNVFMPVYKGDDNSHIMASHAERMKMSACFKVSLEKANAANQKTPSLEPYKNAMTCVTCHNPHVSVRATDPDVFNKACRSCHGGNANHSVTASTLQCSAPQKQRMAIDDNCTSCHMPKNGAIDIPHVRVTDHWIRRPVTPEQEKKIRQFVGLACINNSAVEDKVKGQAFLAYYEKFVGNPAFLDSAKNYFPDKNIQDVRSNFRELIRWAFLKNDYGKVVDYVQQLPEIKDSLTHRNLSNDDAWTSYRIGESFNYQGRVQEAIDYYKKATALAPYDLDFRNKLALAQDNLQLFSEARKNYEFILKENPKIATVHVNYGFLILRMENNPQKALSHYQTALSLDPDNVQAMINSAGVYLFYKDLDTAKGFLKKALSVDPSNAQAKQLLSRL